MILLLAAAALAAPVVCDPTRAAEVLAEARIVEARAPVSHPELLPGLALASGRASDDLRAALADLCRGEAPLSLASAEGYEGAGWAAYTFLLTRADQRGCAVYQRTVAISVATGEGEAPSYSLRGMLPVTSAPLGECDMAPTWREEESIGGGDGPVRLAVVSTWEAGERRHSEVVVRRATLGGWKEQVLASPAPDRLLGGFGGPRIALAETAGESWIVASGSRSGTPGACRPEPGQRVWLWERDRWLEREGRDALALLASRGMWRYAGDDGWLLIVSQVDEDDREKLDLRVRRIEARTGAELAVVPSAWFPELNAGFLIAIPSPFATEHTARTAREAWDLRRRRTYVKRAWRAPDHCADE